MHKITLSKNIYANMLCMKWLNLYAVFLQESEYQAQSLGYYCSGHGGHKETKAAILYALSWE